MSNIDELYKESGIRETQPKTPKQKKALAAILIYLAVFGVIIYTVVEKGLFRNNSNQLYFFLVIASLLITFVARFIIKARKNK